LRRPRCATGFLWRSRGTARCTRNFRKAYLKNGANEDWQIDLAFSHDRLGDALQAQRDLAAALQEYRARLTVDAALADKDPTNDDRERDLGNAHNKIGFVLKAQGNSAGAADEHRAALTILEELAAKGPSNNDWQNDVSITRGWLGDARKRPVTRRRTARIPGAPVDRSGASSENQVTSLSSVNCSTPTEGGICAVRARRDKGQKLSSGSHRYRQRTCSAGVRRWDWLGTLADLLRQLSNVLLDASDRADALTSSEEALKIRRQLYAAGPPPVFKDELVDALGATSFYLLFSRRAEEAAERAAEALSLDPSVVWIETNRAHAYLFLGRFDEAKAIYLDNKDKLVPGGRTFAKAVIDDFEMFRKNGIDIPAMHEIETLLSS
jgi:tetratricopeptide (TPR) repeat protein